MSLLRTGLPNNQTGSKAFRTKSCSLSFGIFPSAKFIPMRNTLQRQPNVEQLRISFGRCMITYMNINTAGRPMVLVGFSGGSINLISSHNSSGILLTVGRYLTLS